MTLHSTTTIVLHDDEEWLSRLLTDTQAIESFPSSLFIERFLNDHDTSLYSAWIEQAQGSGFVVPPDIAFMQQRPASTSTETTLPARLTEPFVHAIALLLNIGRETAVELTTMTLATLAVDIEDDHFEAGLELILKVAETYHRQRIARLELITEFLRINQTESTATIKQPQQQHPSSTTTSEVMALFQQLGPYNLFAILLSAAVPCLDDDAVSTTLSRPQRQALQDLPRKASFTSFVANFMKIQNIFKTQQQNKAMEALIGLCYEHVTVQRAHLVLVSIAWPDTTDALVGLWGVEGVALWRDPQGHSLFQGEHAHEELRALAKLWRRQCLTSKPYILMVLGLGLLLQEAQFPESTELLETANGHDAFGYLYEVLSKRMPPRSLFHEFNQNDELDAASLTYAGIGREVISAAITAFSQNLGDAENVDILCLLAAAVTQNSPIMTNQFWTDWDVHSKGSEERPLCVLLVRAHQLAQANISIPLLRLISSIVSTPESVLRVLDEFIPPHLFSKALETKANNEDRTIVILESIHALAQRATTTETRQALCDVLDPKLLWQAVLECSSERASAAGMEALSLLLQDNAEWVQAIAISFHWIVDEGFHPVVCRGNQTACAAAHFLSSLFRNMTTIFFAPNGDESFIADFLGYFRHALMTVANLLSTSVPMLSKPVLVGQTQLTYQSAISIMDCLRTTLQYAGPIEALHSCVTVCRAAEDFRRSIIKSISGKAIIYYATVPVSLGIARLLDEGVRDAQLVQTQNKSDSFQNWLCVTKQDSLSHPNLQSMIVEALKNPELLSFDFSDMSFQDGDTEKLPLLAASSAIDLLQIWGSVTESKRKVDATIVTALPHELLCAKGDLPQLNPTTSWAVSTLWNAAAITYAGLFACYFQSTTTDAVEASISKKAMDLMATLSEHAALHLDDAFFDTIFESKYLTESLGMQIEPILGSIGDSMQNYSTSCFTILGHCASFRPNEMGKILSSSKCNAITLSIQDICRDVVARKQSGKPLETMVFDVEIARASLYLLLSWYKASYSAKLNQLDIPTGFLHQLLVFLCAPSEEDDVAAAAVVLTDFRRLALDFIAYKLSTSPDEREKKQLIADFESVLGRDLSVLVSLSEQYMQLRHLGPLYEVYDRYFGTFGCAAGNSIVSTLDYFLKTCNWNGRESDDTGFLSAWLGVLRPDNSLSLNELTETFSHFVAETNLLMSWKSMLTMLAILEETNWRCSQQSQVLSLPIKHVTLATMLRTLKTLEGIQPHSLVLTVYQIVVTRLSFMQLHSNSIDESWMEVIMLVAECCRKIIASCLPVHDLLTGVEHLLALSAVILNSARPVYEQAAVVDVCISLADVVCQIIGMIERYHISSGNQDSYLGCLSVCISVLSALMPPQESLGTAWGGQSRYNECFYVLFKSSNATQILSLQVRSRTTNDGNTSDDSHTSQCDIVLLVLALFSKIAVIGEADLLSLLIESELALLLPKHPQFSYHSKDSFPMRGYVEKSKSRHPNAAFDEKRAINISSFARGVDNPHHRVWRSSIKFLAAASRSVAEQNCDLITRTRYYSLALDFLSANTATIMSCLQQCSSIYFNQDYPVLTLNALEETGLILSLASELCSGGALDLFRAKYEDLFNSFLHFSKSLLIYQCSQKDLVKRQKNQ